MFGRKRKRAEEAIIDNYLAERNEIDDAIDNTIDDEIDAPDGIEPLDISGLRTETAALATISKLFDVYRPGVVFSEPVSDGDTTVITASEVHVGLGLGIGRGGGDSEQGSGEGSGVGGGGGSAGRPVAAIIVGPTGVRVEPIFDVTKIVLAFLTTLGAMYMSWRAMQRRK